METKQQPVKKGWGGASLVSGHQSAARARLTLTECQLRKVQKVNGPLEKVAAFSNFDPQECFVSLWIMFERERKLEMTSLFYASQRPLTPQPHALFSHTR